MDDVEAFLAELGSFEIRLGRLQKALYVYRMAAGKQSTRPATRERLAYAVKKACADVAFPTEVGDEDESTVDEVVLRHAAEYESTLREAATRNGVQLKLLLGGKRAKAQTRRRRPLADG